MALLSGTNLGVAAEEARDELTADFARWIPQLRERTPGLFDTVTLDDLRWARSMYFSRRFPPRLLGEEREKPGRGEACGGIDGVMLPFFDLLNHNESVEIDWIAAAPVGTTTVPDAPSSSSSALAPLLPLRCVTFRAGPLGVEPGAEVMNNYGCSKGNEELMASYGFALPRNQNDTYGLSLVVAGTADGTARLGPYYLRRGASNTSEETQQQQLDQFPRAL